MRENPNARWENCDYLLWPEWYSYASIGFILTSTVFGVYFGIAGYL